MDMDHFKNDANLEEDELLAPSKVDLEKVLVEEVGQFGRYQAKAMVLTFIMILVLAIQASEYVFTTARVGSRCLIPECDNKTEGLHFEQPWLSKAVPTTEDGVTPDSCSRFAPLETADLNNKCSFDSFDKNKTMTCEEYVYENTNTVVYDFGLACEDWWRSMIGSARTLGSLVAQPIAGYISDRYGRRTAFLVSISISAVIGVNRYWINNYSGFLASELLEATFGFGIYPCLYILMMETVGSNYRVVVGALISTAFAIGGVVLGFIAWAVPNWRTLTLILYVPQLVSIGTYWLFAESVRWYLSKGKYEETERVLKNIARANGRQLSEKTLRTLRLSAAFDIKEQEANVESDTSEPWLIGQIFRHKPILIRCLVAPVWWITFTFVYYGLTVNSVNLKIGDKYTNYLTVSLFEIPGFWIAPLLVNRIGRRPVLTASYWLCAISIIAFMFIPVEYPKVLLGVYMVAKLCISTVGTSLYLFTSELFPTKSRHRLVAFCSMMGRIGSILAPLTPAFGGKLPFVMFACMGVAAGALILVVPETRGCKLPDTMEEAAIIGARSTAKDKR